MLEPPIELERLPLSPADLLIHTNHTVCCAGILVADMFASPIASLPDPGELATTSGLIMSVGGSAANTAVALRILGQDVNVAGKVGSDLQGDFVISELRRRGIGVSHIRRTRNAATSGTVVINVSGEDRRYIHCIGANAEFRLDDVDFNLLNESEVLYFGGYLALPSFGLGSLTKLLREAKLRGLTTALDVTMPAGDLFELKDVAQALRYTDYFLPNYEEAARLTGEEDERRQARLLSDASPDCTMVITRGPKGPLARSQGRFIETPPLRLESVDESGAGDAFAAGLITAVLKDWELESALLFASAIGASSTQALGCFSSVFTFAEAVSFLGRQSLNHAGWDTFLRAASLSA